MIIPFLSMNSLIPHIIAQCAEEAAGYVSPSGQRDGVFGQQESGTQRSGCKELHVSYWFLLVTHM